MAAEVEEGAAVNAAALAVSAEVRAVCLAEAQAITAITSPSA